VRPAPPLRQFPRYPVVAGIALLAIGITVASWAKVDVSPLFETAMIRRGEFWRLVTSMFPHVGIWHLAFNIYWLWVFGTLVEETFGHLKTAALILMFAIGSGSLEFALASGGVGLSGVGYGLFGLLWILSKRDERFRDVIDRKTIELFVVWFFICIVTTLTNIMPVANIAHGGGAVLGILTGFAITRPDRRALFSSGVAAILVFGVWASTIGRPVVNISSNGGYEEGRMGYEALIANRNQEAVRWFRDAVTYRRGTAVYWFDLGVAYERVNDKSAALGAFRKAADLGEPNAQFFIGAAYDSGGQGLPKDTNQALYWYGKAAVQNSAAAQNNLAWAYATSSDPAIRNPVAALELAQKAVNSEKDHPDPNHLDTLAEAYYVNQKYEEAVETEQQAIALMSAAPAPEEDVSAFQKSLEKYQQALRDSKIHLKTQ
jgi:membrane associated rhomboid family serine protease/TPR repeat protein